jgi:predicted RNase H-like nuclease (RuvC/YqgF family)
MVQIIKTSVKCYKKKAKKTVGGKQKIYEYNQYLVPLKRADNLECGEGVLIIPEQYFEELFGVEDTWSVKEYISKLKGYERNIGEYTKEFQDLKWKHNELSKSYKELLSKHTKYTKKYRMENEKISKLEAGAKELIAKNKELQAKLMSREVELEKLKQDYERESSKATILENELKPDKDKDFWSMLKNRIGKKEIESKKDE